MSFNPPLIIVTSDEPWGDVMHTQLHYAYQLSKHYEVIYINPPRIWTPASGFVDYKRTFRVNTSLLVMPYRHLFPLRILRPFFTFLNDLLTSYSIRKYIPHGVGNILLWRFDHFRFYNAWLPGQVKSIYHVVDNYIGKPGDVRLATDSDLVVVTSPRLVEHYRALNRNVMLIPQCIPEEDNVVDEKLVSGIIAKYGRILLFVGTITREVDIILLKNLARKFKDSNLVLIGPVMNLSASDLELLKDLQSNDNVHFIGSMPGLELKNYIRAAAVCLVPYKFAKERRVQIRSPLKILHYISQKRPVVTSMESEIPDESEMGIRYVQDADSFIGEVESILNAPGTVREDKIDAYLSTATYTYRINEIMDTVSGRLK